MLELIKEKCQQYPVAFVAVVLIILLFLVSFFRGDVTADLQKKYDALVLERQVIDYNQINGRTLASDIKAVYALTDQVKSRLIDPAEKASNYFYFFSLEESTGVTVTDPRLEKITPLDKSKSKKNGTPLAISTYKFNATGNFNQILNLIYELQHGRHFARIKQFTAEIGSGIDPSELKALLQVSFLGKDD